MRYIAFIFFCTVISACSTVERLPPTVSFQTQIEKNQIHQTAAYLMLQARQCWEGRRIDRLTPITVDSYPYEDGHKIELYLVVMDLGKLHAPFAWVDINNSGEIKMWEGDTTCGFLECYNVHATENLEQWLSGDNSCKSLRVHPYHREIENREMNGIK